MSITVYLFHAHYMMVRRHHAFLLELTNQLIKREPADPAAIDEGIRSALVSLGEFFQVDRCRLFTFSEDLRALKRTHQWCADRNGGQEELESEEPVARWIWAVPRILSGRILEIPHVADLPPVATNEKTRWQQDGVQSVLLVRLVIVGQLTGFVDLETTRRRRRWRSVEIELVTAVADLIGRVLASSRSSASGPFGSDAC